MRVSAHPLLRRLIGSNCILIQRGDVPPYYDCMGCVIEKAAACLDDMRHNRSYNVASNCAMNSVHEQYPHECCPDIAINDQGGVNLRYVGSAYPETLRCIAAMGCGSSIIYTQLETECLKACPFKDIRSGGSVCYANFNSANSVRYSTIWTIASIVAMIIYFVSTTV